MRCGVVLFNDAILRKGKGKKRLPTEGWASIDGSQARRIGSITELESDVKWLTNLGFEDFYENQLGRNPNLFPSDFLRTDVKTIAEEVGVSPEQMSSDKAVSVLSTIFKRVMDMAHEKLQVNLNVPVANKGLADYISARVINKNEIADEINIALQGAFQKWHNCVARSNTGWKFAMLRKPRYQHAIDVLSTPVPSENRWVYVNDAKMPVSGPKRIDWCLTQELPVLANVKVTLKRGGDLNTVISYNSGATVERAWLSQPELLWMSMFGEVEVIGAFMCEAGFEHQKEIDAFPSLGEFSFCSYSLGLLSENLWTAMANPRSKVSRKFFPPRAIWYRAIDRFESFSMAAKLHRAGFQVTGYGYGSVCLNYPAGATKDLIDLATEVGLDIPVAKYFEQRNEVRLLKDE